MIDFHCHLDLYPNPSEIISRAVNEKMYVLAVTTTPRAIDGTLALIGEAPRIRVALGLHPELIAERYKEVSLVCDFIPRFKYIGEIGLDGTPAHKSSLTLQIKVFDQILDSCEKNGGRVISVHSRGAAGLVLDCLERHPSSGKWILHWFSGTPKELKRAIDMGCYFSIGPAMLQSQKGISLGQTIPKNRVLTESDGPLAISGGNALMPWSVYDAVKELARIWGVSISESEHVIHENLRQVLQGMQTL